MRIMSVSMRTILVNNTQLYLYSQNIVLTFAVKI
nr:MAG TPA: hypothetical protein [Caudoviricetes sp.]